MSDADSEKGRVPALATPKERGSYPAGFVGTAYRAMDFLVEHGVEERGIQPRPEDERERLSTWSYVQQYVFWSALNTNILSFSEGMLGPALFGLDFKATVLVVVLFNIVMCAPPAWLATNGPRTGMRQMVQARYAMGFVPAMVISLANCLTLLGYLSLTTILGGQCLSLASDSSMSWTVGIVVVALIGVCLSFIGLRALHYLSLTSLPVVVLLYLVLLGVTGSKLHLVNSDLAKAATKVTASGVLGFGASQVGFSVSYAGIASDFTTLLPASTPRLPLFFAVYFGLFFPIVLIQLFGAALMLVSFSIPRWNAAAEVAAPNLLFTVTGESHAARFVMVLFCLSVVANVAPTIYSCGLSGTVVLPFLTRVPRYFLAILVIAIVLPVAIVGANHFVSVLSNFLAVLGYWTALYLPPALLEPLLFRNPVDSTTYPVAIWNRIGKLPIGLAFIASSCAGIPLAAAGMSQTWWNGWISRKIPGGDGDLGFELTFAVVTLVFVPLRYLERKYTGR
ncbi:hypothetical protein Q8F55_007112 [Vanrija albida]|uniref:Cytosine-purine permease n=1 Tax=Vanrija albida TaxID=181172 RepID=A0ABR3PYV3_9TREE